MNKTKLFDWDSVFDFGMHKGKTIKETFDESPSYINWCFQMVDRFCITDDIFNNIDIVILLKNGAKQNHIESITTLKRFEDLHELKKKNIYQRKIIEDDEYKDDYDFEIKDDNPWRNVFGDSDEANQAYWNTD